MNERQRLVLFILISAVVLFTYQPILHYLGLLPPPPTRSTTMPMTAPTTAPGEAIGGVQSIVPATTQSVEAAPGTAIIEAPKTQPAAIRSASDAVSRETIVLGSRLKDDPNYALELAINPVGGGLDSVVLNKYKQQVDSDAPFTFERPYTDPGTAAFSTRSVTLNGQTHDIRNQVWRADRTGDTATLTLDLATADGNPLVRLTKSFKVLPRTDAEDGPQGYEIEFSQTVQNTSTQPQDISTTILGPTFPASELARGGDRQLIAGYRGDGKVVLHYDYLEAFTADYATKDYTGNKDGLPLLWIGAGTNYFNAIVRPESPWVARATGTAVNPNAAPHDRQVTIALETVPTGTIAPGTASTINADVFFGPRLRSLLKTSYYTDLSRQYFHTLEISGSCTYCAFSDITTFLMWLLGKFHAMFGDWGLAIIALVFIVRAVLHPITKKSQVNMAKMAKMGPEIERIKKKYGDDKEAMNRAMMEFYKNHGATPILGCLPMFLQMPIWISLYSGLSTTFELRHEPFFYGLTWIKDLSKPDHLIEFSEPYNFLFLHIDGLNIIPILLMVVFYFQYKLQPKPPAMTDEQKSQQRMMMWMTTLLFPIMLYPMPSGLNIYIFASTLFGVIESKIIRNHIDKQEALKPTGPQFVEGEVIDGKSANKKPEPTKPCGIFGWFAKLQQRAEELRAEAEKKAQQKRK
jgi:YidC/Oxa1 family membrane protein insertase